MVVITAIFIISVILAWKFLGWPQRLEVGLSLPGEATSVSSALAEGALPHVPCWRTAPRHHRRPPLQGCRAETSRPCQPAHSAGTSGPAQRKRYTGQGLPGSALTVTCNQHTHVEGSGRSRGGETCLPWFSPTTPLPSPAFTKLQGRPLGTNCGTHKLGDSSHQPLALQDEGPGQAWLVTLNR